MSLDAVKNYLSQFGADCRVLEFDVSSATVELAARALGCESGRIAKTLSFDLHGDTALIVAAGDVKVDNRKFKEYFGIKAKMPAREETEERTGHAAGGVCPFAVKRGVRVYLDVSLKRFDIVYPACGSANSAIALSIDELEKFSRPVGWLDVCKPVCGGESGE